MPVSSNQEFDVADPHNLEMFFRMAPRRVAMFADKPFGDVSGFLLLRRSITRRSPTPP